MTVSTKKLIKYLMAALTILSVIALVWINTGSHQDTGFTICGNFIPYSNSTDTNYHGCAFDEGHEVTRHIKGRLNNHTIVVNEVFGALAGVGLTVYLVKLMEKHKAPNYHK